MSNDLAQRMQLSVPSFTDPDHTVSKAIGRKGDKSVAVNVVRFIPDTDVARVIALESEMQVGVWAAVGSFCFTHYRQVASLINTSVESDRRRLFGKHYKAQLLDILPTGTELPKSVSVYLSVASKFAASGNVEKLIAAFDEANKPIGILPYAVAVKAIADKPKPDKSADQVLRDCAEKLVLQRFSTLTSGILNDAQLAVVVDQLVQVAGEAKIRALTTAEGNYITAERMDNEAKRQAAAMGADLIIGPRPQSENAKDDAEIAKALAEAAAHEAATESKEKETETAK